MQNQPASVALCTAGLVGNCPGLDTAQEGLPETAPPLSPDRPPPALVLIPPRECCKDVPWKHKPSFWLQYEQRRFSISYDILLFTCTVHTTNNT